jgi:HAD superfamily hydrolase (TIGR01509 family)
VAAFRTSRRKTAGAYGETVLLTNPELVIFDCDGILVDTERIAIPIDAAVITELGWPMTEEEVIERFVGRSAEDCNRDIEAHIGRSLPPELYGEIDRRYEEAFERELTSVDGVEAVLDALAQAHVAMCVASSGTHDKMRFTLGLTGLLARFEGRLFSADEVEHGKPAPDLFLHAAAVSGVEPARCAVIEDSPFGLAAALAAGMAAYGFAGGMTPASLLQLPGAIVFNKMSELPGLLGL